MSRKATTFRLEPIVEEGLAKLSAILHSPQNKLVNEAIREYVARRLLVLESELESTIEDLRAYRQRDPDFEQSIARFADAEAAASNDPAEGTVFVEKAGTPIVPAGPAQTAVLKVLGG